MGLVVVAILAVATTGAMGQNSDDFDSYTAGAVIPPGNDWGGWGGAAAANCIVTAGPANSSPNSLAAVGGAGTDQVFEFGYGPKTGTWDFSAMTYIPSEGKAGETYFNLMNRFDQVTPVYHWSNVEVHWRMKDAAGADVDLVWNNAFQPDEAAVTLPIQYDTWVEVSADINLTNNTVEVFYGGVSLGAAAWADDPVHGIDCMDIFPITSDASVIYYDDISLVPEPTSLVMLLGLGLGALAVYLRRRR